MPTLFSSLKFLLQVEDSSDFRKEGWVGTDDNPLFVKGSRVLSECNSENLQAEVMATNEASLKDGSLRETFLGGLKGSFSKTPCGGPRMGICGWSGDTLELPL